MHFLGLGLTDKVPDAKTIWAFRERLETSGNFWRLGFGHDSVDLKR